MTKWYNGPLTHTISVSQINMFANVHDPMLWEHSSCPRKWALHYLAKVPRIPSTPMQFGIEMHECVEDLFSMSDAAWSEKWPPEYVHGTTKHGAMAQAMRRQSDYCENAVIEADYIWEIPELDVAVYIKPDIHDPNHEWFGDWKSTSATDRQGRYVLQQPEFWPKLKSLGERPPKIKMLADDVQALVYAHRLMEMWDIPKIRAQWVYCTKKFQHGETPHAWTVRALFHRNETAERIQREIYPIIELMIGLRKTIPKKNIDAALMVPHNPIECGHRGRFCDALGSCNFQKSEVKFSQLRKVLGR